MQMKEYFKGSNIDAALDGYHEYIRGKKDWDIGYKIEMYEKADDIGRNSEKGLESFGFIYEELRSRWQVFRNAKKRSSPEEIYRSLIDECYTCSSDGEIDLVNLKSEHIPGIMKCIDSLGGIKTTPSGGPSMMAISKFLHFYNPGLFPIYDGDVIKNELIRCFADEYTEFRKKMSTQFRKNEILKGTSEYLSYMFWASELMKDDTPHIMDRFLKWVKDITRDPKKVHILEMNYSFAYESIAIGAMRLECESS